MTTEDIDTSLTPNNYVDEFEYNGNNYIIDPKEYYETGKKNLAVPWLKEAFRKSHKYQVGSIDEKLFFTVIKPNSDLGLKEYWRTPEEYSKFSNIQLNKDQINNWYEEQEKIRKGNTFRINSINGFKFKKVYLQNSKIEKKIIEKDKSTVVK